jgi:hypothetical protein
MNRTRTAPRPALGPVALALAALALAAAADIAVRVAQTTAAGNGGTLTELYAMVGAVPAGTPAGGVELRGAFATAAASETTFTVGNVTYTLTLVFYDAGGGELSQYGPAAVRMRVTARARSFYRLAHLAVADVRVLKSREFNPWPLSGTATWAVHAERLRSNNRADVEAAFDAVVVRTCNGTQYPEVTVDGTYRYRMNLNSGAIVRL